MPHRPLSDHRCACGQPLHYRNPRIQAEVQRLVDELGELTRVRTPDGEWLVPRHYIALHGLSAYELPRLAKQYGWLKVGNPE